MRKVALIALVLLAMAFLMREQVWEVIGGPPDQGPIDFATLSPPETPNRFLVCPKTLCAKADAEAPVFALPAEALRDALHAALTAEPDLSDPIPESGLSERYVQRTLIMRFPDTIAVRYIPVTDKTSTLAVYSRSLLGKDDRGVNRERVERWLRRLSALPRAQP